MTIRRLRLRGAAHSEGDSRESFDFVTGDLVVKLTVDRLRSAARRAQHPA